MRHVWSGLSWNITNGRRHKKHLTLTNKTCNGGMWRDEESLTTTANTTTMQWLDYSWPSTHVWWYHTVQYSPIIFFPLLLLLNPLSRECMLKHAAMGCHLWCHKGHWYLYPIRKRQPLWLPYFCLHPKMLKVQQSITFSGKLKATLCFQRAVNRGLIMHVSGRILELFLLDWFGLSLRTPFICSITVWLNRMTFATCNSL